MIAGFDLATYRRCRAVDVRAIVAYKSCLPHRRTAPVSATASIAPGYDGSFGQVCGRDWR